MWFANSNTLTISLPICIYFIISSYLIAFARISKTMLNRIEKGRHPCLIHDLMGNCFSFSQLSMRLAIGLSYIAFIMLRYIPSIPSFLKDFIMMWC
jgi:hypothetical protein